MWLYTHSFVISLWKYFSFEIQQKRNISQWQIFGSMQKCIEIRTPFRNWCCHNFPDSHLLHNSQFHNLHVIGLYKLFCLGLIGFLLEDILWKAFSFTPHRPFRLPTGVSWYKSCQTNYQGSIRKLLSWPGASWHNFSIGGDAGGSRPVRSVIA